MGNAQKTSAKWPIFGVLSWIAPLPLGLAGSVISDAVQDDQLGPNEWPWLPDFMRFDNGFTSFAVCLIGAGLAAALCGILAFKRREFLCVLSAPPCALRAMLAVYLIFVVSMMHLL